MLETFPMATAPPIEIVHNVERHRFEAIVDGGLARCDYRRVGNVLQLHHTEVPVALEEGMRTLKQDGMEKCLAGVTHLKEVRAVCIK